MSENNFEAQTSTGFNRRSVVKGAAWSVPVIAAAIAAPAASASNIVNVGAFVLDGDCGVLGVLGAGFELTAGAVDLPVGTIIDIVGSGIANIGLFSVTGGTADVTALGGSNTNQIILTAPLTAGTTLQLRSLVSLGAQYTLVATATLPAGYTSTGAKSTGTVSSIVNLANPLGLCSDT